MNLDRELKSRIELSKLRDQLVRVMLRMTWDSGFRTSRRSWGKFNIRVGRTRIGSIYRIASCGDKSVGGV